MLSVRLRKISYLSPLQRIFALLSIVMVAGVLMPVMSSAKMPVIEFEDAALFVVYSETDEDAQIFVQGGSEEPIKKVTIFGPNGTVRHKAHFKDKGRIGQADFQFETPEPSLEELKEAYPAGEYRFSGKTVDGGKLESIVELSYELLKAPEVFYPQEGDTDVPVEDLVVTFKAPAETEAIRLEIEDEETEVAIKVDLPGDATEFAVPDGWLQPGTVYVLDIKAIAENGNQTVVDVEFTTVE